MKFDQTYFTRLRLAWTLLLVFILQHTITCGQELSTVGFTVEDGLPSNETYDIVEDSKGQIWICTDRGVSRYNGHRFTNYNTSNSNLTSNTVFKAFIRNENEIWFSAMDRSFSIFDIQADSFRSFKYNNELKKEWTLWSESVRFTKEIIYLYHSSGGRGQNGDRIALYHVREDSLSFMSKVDYFADKTNHFTASFEFPATIPRRLYRSVVFDDDFASLPDELLHEPIRIRRIDNRVSLNGQHFFGVGDEVSTFADGTFRVIANLGFRINQTRVDRTGTVHFLTDGGDFMLQEDSMVRRLSKYRLTGFCEDFEQNTWYSTLNNGIFYVAASRVQERQDISSALPSHKIHFMSEFKDHLVISDHGARVFATGKNETLKEVVKDSSKFIGVGSVRVQLNSFVKLGDTGYMPNAWALILDKGKPKIIANGYANRMNFVIPVSNEAQMYCEHRGYLILESNQLDTLKTASLHRLNNHSKEIPYKVISVCKTDNYIWLGTTQGLWKVPLDDLHNPSQVLKDDLNLRINKLLADEFGKIYMATMGKGLCILHADSLIECGELQGAPSNLANDIAIENETSIWVASTRGLYEVQYDGAFGARVGKRFGKSDGIANMNLGFITIWNGKIWLATSSRIYTLSLTDLNIALPSPKLSIVDCLHADTSVLGSAYLKYTENNLMFKCLAITQHKNPAGLYRYRLNRGSKQGEWIIVTDGDIQLNDLQPGKYTFQVAARSRDDLWSEPQQYQFRIVPHLTQTTLFRVGLVFLAIAIVVLYFLRQARIEAERTGQRAKIKDLELNSLINQMNPHFVFNSLNSLQNLIVENEQETSLTFIGDFSSLMRSSLHFSQAELIPIEKEIVFLTQYLNTEKLRFKERFEYSITCDPDLLDVGIQIPPLLLQPLLENAVKHAFVDTAVKGQIKLSFKEEDEMVHIELEDNGVGIHSGKVKLKNGKVDSQGSKIVQQRIEIMKDKYPDFPIKLRVIDLSRDVEGRTGTLIKITLPILD